MIASTIRKTPLTDHRPLAALVERLGIGEDPRPEVLVRRGEVRAQPRRDHVELGARILQRRPFGEAAEDLDRRPRPRRERRAVGAERDPEVLVLGEGEARRHHTHHGRRGAAHLERAADDARIGIEARRPERVTEDQHQWLGRILVPGEDRAPVQRRRSHDAEGARGDLGADRRLDLAVLRREVALEAHRGAEPLDGSQLPAPGGEVVQQPRLRREGVDVPFVQRDDPIGVGDREARVLELVDRLEVDRAERHGDRHRERPDRRQHRIACEHPETDPQVEEGQSDGSERHDASEG
jgi:hypothetical protein